MSARWHITKEAGIFTLSRQLPARFDVAAQTHLPPARPERLAHQIRQDVWRALSHLRGFSPAVRLEPIAEGWCVTAGGRVMGRVTPHAQAAIQDVLNDVTKRARWLKNARIAP